MERIFHELTRLLPTSTNELEPILVAGSFSLLMQPGVCTWGHLHEAPPTKVISSALSVLSALDLLGSHLTEKRF